MKNYICRNYIKFILSMIFEKLIIIKGNLVIYLGEIYFKIFLMKVIL